MLVSSITTALEGAAVCEPVAEVLAIPAGAIADPEAPVIE